VGDGLNRCFVCRDVSFEEFRSPGYHITPSLVKGQRLVTHEDLVDLYNASLPIFMPLLGGKVVAVDSAAQAFTFQFDIGTDCCHSVHVVQGGFVTAMLDAATTQPVFAANASAVANLTRKK